ncbi:MAG: SusD/RagB family nutrient-binding outer membrane lipoprotein [Bacteroidia bacterium]
MKKILALVLTVSILSSCGDLTELNVDTKSPQTVPAGSLFANATKELSDWMSSSNVNENNWRLWSQQWTQTTYVDESNYELIERDVNGNFWDRMYATVLRDLAEARLAVDADEILLADYKKNQLAMIDVLEVYTYAVLVDVWGDVPRSEAMSETVTPVYDDDKAVYDAIITQLNAAIGNLGGDSGMGASDLLYGGDADMWKKFANSLKLRLAIRLADSDNARAKTMAEEAVTSGVFASSADDCELAYMPSTPNTNPVWEDLVESGRSDFVAANTMGDYMNALADPRRAFYYRNLGGADSVFGGVYGEPSSYPAHSQPSDLMEDPTLPGVLLSYTEVSFLLADASERGYAVGGTAEEHYNNGVSASIIEWGGDQDMADAYLATADVAYSTAQGTWKEKIALQKWLAMYNQGFEAWSTYRVYDAPVLNAAAEAGTTPPTRYTYPIDESSLNGDNVDAAKAKFGNDDSFAKIFWDVN